jgi:hypothetical protein
VQAHTLTAALARDKQANSFSLDKPRSKAVERNRSRWDTNITMDLEEIIEKSSGNHGSQD